VRQTYGTFGMLGQVVQGLRIWRKKPEVIHKPHKIQGAEELARIYDALDTDAEAPK